MGRSGAEQPVAAVVGEGGGLVLRIRDREEFYQNLLCS